MEILTGSKSGTPFDIHGPATAVCRRRPSAATQRPPAGVPHQQAAPAYTEHLTDLKLNYIPSAEIQEAMNDEELQRKTERALKDYDIAFLLDDSGSMQPHWDHVKRLLGLLTDEAVKHDKNGLDLHFLNHGSKYPNLTSAKAVAEVMTK
ncbi:hypothetical protein BDZ89DRAFT_227083 [Hymenopellis radicata]|nr:hypothetical protein BDZ89DRAFT_227083 [Hymenopellis radicata]